MDLFGVCLIFVLACVPKLFHDAYQVFVGLVSAVNCLDSIVGSLDEALAVLADRVHGVEVLVVLFFHSRPCGGLVLDVNLIRQVNRDVAAEAARTQAGSALLLHMWVSLRGALADR